VPGVGALHQEVVGRDAGPVLAGVVVHDLAGTLVAVALSVASGVRRVVAVWSIRGVLTDIFSSKVDVP
jgi:hypothetical protein